jgi:hypothetical protein
MPLDAKFILTGSDGEGTDIIGGKVVVGIAVADV